MNAVKRFEISIKTGKNSMLYAENGDEYLDMIAGIASVPFGYQDKELQEFITNQIYKNTHIPFYLHSPELTKACDIITKLTIPDSKVFFINSGTEACETAIKIIRKHFQSQGKNDKNEIICFKNSFHGRTFGSIAAQGNEKYLEGFEPRLSGFKHAVINDISSVKALISHRTAGIMLEPIQGEGGMTTCTKEFMQDLRKLCDENEIILALDEVQCGLGRTGKLSTFENFGIIPDILINAKALGGGVIPVSSCVSKRKFADSMTFGSHGGTFGGNPLSTGVASYVLNRISNKEFLDSVILRSNIIRSELSNLQRKYQIIEEVRGIGLMIGVKINESVKNTDIIQKAIENHLVLAPASKDNVIRVLPCLNVDMKSIDMFVEKFSKSVASF